VPVQNNFGFRLGTLGLVLILSLIFTLLVGVLDVSAQEDNPTLTGELSTDLFLYSGSSVAEFPGFNSTLSLTYLFSGLRLKSISRFANTNSHDYVYRGQNFSLDTRIGILDLSSDVVFSPKDQRIDYWLSSASTTFAGFTVTENFLLEFLDLPPGIGPGPGYGSGSEIVLNGKTSQGLEIEFSSRFGMEVSELEKEGVEDGSGYDIITNGNEGPFTYSPSSLQYVSSTIKVADHNLGCCEFDSETWFSREKGFEYTEFEFFMNAENMPVSIGADIQYAPRKKSVLIDPQLDVNGSCFDLYLDFSEKDKENHYNLELKGFGLQGIKISDAVTLDTITSLKGNLYRNAGTNDISLRASGYTIDPLTPAYYVGPLNFDQVASIAARMNGLTNLGLDVYFNMSDSDQLFDFHKFTGDATFVVDRQFTFGTGVEFIPEGRTTFMLEADYSF